jgi:predicted pyridoxine 5'-phosphate oxidase superfamily flavin-nucleotide-binding protein
MTEAKPIDIAFSDRVKAVQERKGSRKGYARMEMAGEITSDLAAFLAERDSFYLATASADGQPYIQHRGGPKGFLKVLDEKHLAFADYKGNRQFISTGNLEENPKVALFLMDYANRRRIKVWGKARVIEDDPALLARLMPEGYRARGEQVVVIEVSAWDVNCPQHIPQKVDLEAVKQVLSEREARIAELEDEVAKLRAKLE